MGQGSGRDHHILAFSVFLAGGGAKPGFVYGATDYLWIDPWENVVSVHDLHATLLYLMGIDHRRLTVKFQGLDARLTGVAVTWSKVFWRNATGMILLTCVQGETAYLIAIEFVEVTKLAPLGHDEVAVLVNRSAVRGVADAVLPLVLRQAEVGALFLIGIVADLRGDVAVLVQHGDAALQLREHGVVAADMHGGGHPQVFLDDFHEIAVEVPVFHAIVVAVANEQQRLALARVQRDAVTGLELSFLLARPAKGFHELAVLVELEHVVRAVAVGDENRAIGSDGDGAGIESLRVLVDARLLRKLNRPLLFAVELELDDLVIGRARGVDVFHAVLLADLQPVNARRADGAQEFALGRKDHDAALGVGGDVNIARLVDHHAAVAGAECLFAGLLLEEIRRDGILQFGGECHG